MSLDIDILTLSLAIDERGLWGHCEKEHCSTCMKWWLEMPCTVVYTV